MQQLLGYVPTVTPEYVVLIRVVVAGILGGAIGFERGADNSVAGLRTHILIAAASCLFTQLAFEIHHVALVGGSNNPDPVRAVEAITAGIAFLGAGAIFRRRGDVQGLTTGAGMWLAGAIGVAIAMGYYVIGAAVAVLAVLVMAALRHFSHNVLREHKDS